jgi:hypothetical protein
MREHKERRGFAVDRVIEVVQFFGQLQVRFGKQFRNRKEGFDFRMSGGVVASPATEPNPTQPNPCSGERLASRICHFKCQREGELPLATSGMPVTAIENLLPITTMRQGEGVGMKTGTVALTNCPLPSSYEVP